MSDDASDMMMEAGAAEVSAAEVPVETEAAVGVPEVTEPVAEGGADEGASEAAAEAAEAPEFQMVWPEGYEATERFTEITTAAAKAVGVVDGELAGAYTAKVIEALQEAGARQAEADDAALKEDWGAEYAENMQGCKEFMKRMSAKAGLSEADMAVLESPKGMRLIQAIRAEVGEGVAAVGSRATDADLSWAREVMSNPAHPDYKAFHNPSDPRWREVNKRFNVIKGF